MSRYNYSKLSRAYTESYSDHPIYEACPSFKRKPKCEDQMGCKWSKNLGCIPEVRLLSPQISEHCCSQNKGVKCNYYTNNPNEYCNAKSFHTFATCNPEAKSNKCGKCIKDKNKESGTCYGTDKTCQTKEECKHFVCDPRFKRCTIPECICNDRGTCEGSSKTCAKCTGGYTGKTCDISPSVCERNQWKDPQGKCHDYKVCPTTWSQKAPPYGNDTGYHLGINNHGYDYKITINSGNIATLEEGTDSKDRVCLSDVYTLGWPNCWGNGCMYCHTCNADANFDGKATVKTPSGVGTKLNITPGMVTVRWTETDSDRAVPRDRNMSDDGTPGCAFGGKNNLCGWKK